MTNAQRSDGPEATWEALGVLHQDAAVRLLNISRSGCLLESDQPVESGVVGRLRFVLDGRVFEDRLRVVRCTRIAGAGRVFHVGAQFLWADAPRATALRRLADWLMTGGQPADGTAASQSVRTDRERFVESLSPSSAGGGAGTDNTCVNNGLEELASSQAISSPAGQEE